MRTSLRVYKLMKLISFSYVCKTGSTFYLNLSKSKLALYSCIVISPMILVKRLS